LRHGHAGVYRQSQKERNYIGVIVLVGMMSSRQMRRLADGVGTARHPCLLLFPFQGWDQAFAGAAAHTFLASFKAVARQICPVDLAILISIPAVAPARAASSHRKSSRS